MSVVGGLNLRRRIHLPRAEPHCRVAPRRHPDPRRALGARPSFPRAFGRQTETIFEPASLLPLLATKPGAWGPSPLRALVTDPIRDWLDAAAATDRRRLLNAVDAASGSVGFDAAMAAADTLILRGDTPDMAALGMLARRLAHGTEPAAANVDLSVYDTFTTLNTSTGEVA